MSGRRGGNRIRGPQSALTDFLAANNISAAQIRDEYERRRRTADDEASASAGASAAATPATPATPDANDETIAAAIAAEVAEEEEKTEKSAKRKRKAEEAVAKVKKAKKAKQSSKKNKKKGSDDESDFEDDLMYSKARPLPGQLENCDVCNKRFTVTPYSKEGPDGGLLCTPCGKELAKDMKAEKKATSKPAGRKRRKVESDRLDGIANGGAKSLQQLCIAKVAQHHDDIDEFGDMPQQVLERLSEIFSKKRVLKPKTLPLFLRPDLDAVMIHDAAYLEEDDYERMFATVPKMEKLVLSNACQFKDAAINYLLEKCDTLRHIHLYAANLVSDGMWYRLFREAGPKLEVLKLKWLDASFDDLAVEELVKFAPGLKRLKLKLCRKIGEAAVRAISDMQQLEHLSLMMNKEVSTPALAKLVMKRGPKLQTLSLEKFLDADDSVLEAIRSSCQKLSKLRISENDTITDAGYESLFNDWTNPPLTFVDFNSTRDVDNNNPGGPEDAVGMASAGFKALMKHSGSDLKHIDIASCRHIELGAFMDVFNGEMNYPNLEYINVSFCNRVDNSVIAGIFKSCPNLKKLVAFGCFDVLDIVVPRNIALIGVPKAQDAIEQFGVGIGVEEAISRMVEVNA